MFWLIHAIHLLSVITILGGAIVLRFVVCPKIPSDEAGAETRKAVLSRWRKFVGMGIAIIILSGLSNMVYSYQSVGGNPLYWGIFLVKFVAAILLFTISFMLVLPIEGLEKFKQNRDKWMLRIAILGAVIVGISAFLRHLHRALPAG